MDPMLEPDAPAEAATAEAAVSPAPQNTAAEDESTTFDLGRAVGKIAGFLHPESGALSTGERAELRRISPDQPFTPALWKMLLALGRADAPSRLRQPEWERRWATLMMGMAFCAGLHDFDVPLGRALAEAGWSELRLTRLLRAEGEALETEVRRLAQYLGSKSERADWTGIARLLFYQSGQIAAEIRLEIARTYYRTLYAQQEK